MKYGITKPHIKYQNGWWHCKQKNFTQTVSRCPFFAFLHFSEEKHKQIEKYKKIFNQDT